MTLSFISITSMIGIEGGICVGCEGNWHLMNGVLRCLARHVGLYGELLDSNSKIGEHGSEYVYAECMMVHFQVSAHQQGLWSPFLRDDYNRHVDT